MGRVSSRVEWIGLRTICNKNNHLDYPHCPPNTPPYLTRRGAAVQAWLVMTGHVMGQWWQVLSVRRGARSPPTRLPPHLPGSGRHGRGWCLGGTRSCTPPTQPGPVSRAKPVAGGVAQTRCVWMQRHWCPWRATRSPRRPRPWTNTTTASPRHRAGHNFMQSRGVGDGTHRGEGLGKVM